MITIWSKYNQQLRRFVAKRVADPHTVDDLMHDIFLKTSKQLRSLKKPKAIGSWLYQIAMNTIIDYYRLKKNNHEDIYNTNQSATNDFTPFKDLTQCISPMLLHLPEKYRIPLVLSDLEGVPQKDIAIQLSLSNSGVKSRIQRGRKLLRLLLIKHCEIRFEQQKVVDFELKKSCCLVYKQQEYLLGTKIK